MSPVEAFKELVAKRDIMADKSSPKTAVRLLLNPCLLYTSDAADE